MLRISPSAVGDGTADRVMGHRPELLDAWDSVRNAPHGPASSFHRA